jgi:hypothetical protein
MTAPRPWELQTLPCILRAWNNYHGYSKYTEPAPDHQNTLDYFHTLVPEGFATVTIPSAYFHIATQQKWIERIDCTSLFIVNGTHIYLVKRQSDGGWRRYDWPYADLYENIYELERSTHHTLFVTPHSSGVGGKVPSSTAGAGGLVVLLYPVANYEKLKGCFVDWVPKRTEFYLAFKRRLMAVAAQPPVAPQT